MTNLQVKIINDCTPELIKAVAYLRTAAWKASTLSIYKHTGTDFLDECSIHFLAFDENTMVAAARVTLLEKNMINLLSNEQMRLFDYSNRPAMFSRLVTKPEARHRGIARRLTFERLDYLKNTGYDAFAYIRLSCAEYYHKTYGFEILEETDQPYPNSGLVHLKF